MRGSIGARRGAFDELLHDVRNPLTSIQGCALTLLERDDLPSETRRALTGVIVRQAKQLDVLLQAALERDDTSRRAV